MLGSLDKEGRQVVCHRQQVGPIIINGDKMREVKGIDVYMYSAKSVRSENRALRNTALESMKKTCYHI